MPTWNEFVEEIKSAPNPHDQLRRRTLSNLSDKTGRNAIVYYSGWQDRGVPRDAFSAAFSINDADKNGFMAAIHGLNRDKGLDLLLHTPGGDIAATESLVYYLKQMFGTNIRAIVPQMAMSAGSMIACACSEVLMGKHSNLGPVDPQVDGMPAHGIIEEFETAKEEIRNDSAAIDTWRPIIAKYSPTLIGRCLLAIEWSEQLVEEWLCENMLSEYKDKLDRAQRIRKGLTEQRTTKSHSRHYHIDQLREMGMKVKSLEEDQELQDAVLSVHHACKITLSGKPVLKLIENSSGAAFVTTMSPN